MLLLLQVLLVLLVRSSSAVPRTAARTARHRIADAAAVQASTIAQTAFSLAATCKPCTDAAVDLAADARLHAGLWLAIAKAHTASPATNLTCTLLQTTRTMQPMLLLLLLGQLRGVLRL
jgi:hypothetical protein